MELDAPSPALISSWFESFNSSFLNATHSLTQYTGAILDYTRAIHLEPNNPTHYLHQVSKSHNCHTSVTLVSHDCNMTITRMSNDLHSMCHIR